MFIHVLVLKILTDLLTTALHAGLFQILSYAVYAVSLSIVNLWQQVVTLTTMEAILTSVNQSNTRITWVVAL